MARLLLDECVDRRLRRSLVGHQTATVQEMGWSARSDRDVLTLAADEGFESVITVDRNLPFQQHVDELPLCVIVIHGRSSRLVDLMELLPKLLAALDHLRPGTVVTIEPDPAHGR